MPGEGEQISVRTIDFVRPAVREILQTSATLEEAIRRVDAMLIQAYTLPVSANRIVVILAGENQDVAGEMTSGGE